MKAEFRMKIPDKCGGWTSISVTVAGTYQGTLKFFESIIDSGGCIE